MTDLVPWILRGRTGRVIGRWLNRHAWELHRVVRVDGGTALAKVRIQPGHVIQLADITDVRTFGGPGPQPEKWQP